MEFITSRKNALIRSMRELGRERKERTERGEFLCDGEKLLREALDNGAEITTLLCADGDSLPPLPGVRCCTVPLELLQYVSPLENSAGPVFAVKMRPLPAEAPRHVLVLENVQDPGNVGTVLRTAAAFEAGLVVLLGDCADPFNPKTVRASMGAVFRQRFALMTAEELFASLEAWQLPLYGAALHTEARDVRELPLTRCAVAVGNEGRGLSEELLARCERKLIIPMAQNSESLNAAVASAVILWEMYRR